MNKTDALTILKLSLGSSLAIFIASFFNLEYSIVAGVITLLVVKDTKRDTIEGVLGKILGFILCTIFSYLCFKTFGYTLYSFSLYILIIITICFILKIRYVIAMCVVISSHYLLQGTMNTYWVLNETGLFIIGASIGVIVNLFMFSNIKQIHRGQEKLQKEVSLILIDIAKMIDDPDYKPDLETSIDKLNNLIKKSVSAAYENMNNNLLSDTRFFLEHMEIIKNQRDILGNLYELISQLEYIPEQGYIISEFINKIGNTSFEVNTVNILLNDLDEIYSSMKAQPLPKTRSEFENRAILFLCLVELRKYLNNRKNAQILRDNYYYN